MPTRRNKKKQIGGQKKTAKKKCMCQKGGMLLSPAQMKMLTRPRKFKTMPVKRQKGMGHGCMCNQCGGSFFGDIGSAFKRLAKNPLRLAAAIGTAGASEVIAMPADIIKHKTGIKTSDVLSKAAPVISAVGGPQLALGSKLTSVGLKQIGLGKRRLIRQPILV